MIKLCILTQVEQKWMIANDHLGDLTQADVTLIEISLMILTLTTKPIPYSSWFKGGPPIWTWFTWIWRILIIMCSNGARLTFTAIWIWVDSEVASTTLWNMCIFSFNYILWKHTYFFYFVKYSFNYMHLISTSISIAVLIVFLFDQISTKLFRNDAVSETVIFCCKQNLECCL